MVHTFDSNLLKAEMGELWVQSQHELLQDLVLIPSLITTPNTYRSLGSFFLFSEMGLIS